MLPHPTHQPLHALAKHAANRIGKELPIPKGLTIADVELLQKKYPHAPIERIHLPFSHDLVELWTAPIRTPGKKAKVRSAGWIYFFGRATNMHGVKMAERFGADINAHTNVIVGFADRSKEKPLREKLKTTGDIFVENDPSYTSRFVKDKRAQGDPIYMAEKLVNKYQLDGLVLGVDHMLEYAERTGQDVLNVLQNPSVQQQTRIMHIAGSNHAIDLPSDEKLQEFLTITAKTYFTHPVKAALDLNPQQLVTLPKDDRFHIIQSLANHIMNTQQNTD
jgi:hypothetical protein